MHEHTIWLLTVVLCPLCAIVLAIGGVYTMRQTHKRHHVREGLKLFAASFVALLLFLNALLPGGVDVVR